MSGIFRRRRHEAFRPRRLLVSGVSGDVVAIVGQAPTASDATADLTATVPIDGGAPTASGATATNLTNLISATGQAPSAAWFNETTLTGTVPLVGQTPTASDLDGSPEVSYAVDGQAPTASEATGSADRAREATAQAPTASEATGALSATVPISGNASAASEATGAADALTLVSGDAAAASGFDGNLTGTVPIDGQAPTSSDFAGSTEIQYALNGGAPTASDGVATLNVATDFSVTGQASAASQAMAVLLVTGPRWTFIDGGDSYQLTPGPTTAETPRIDKKAVRYSHVRSSDSKTLMYVTAGDVQEIVFTGSILTQAQYDAFEDWAALRDPWVIRDDMFREWSVVTKSYTPRRIQKADTPWYHTYTWTFTVLDVV